MERARARERQQDTIQNLAKKEKDRKKAKRLDADKRLDAEEMYRVKRQQKQEEEWDQRDRAQEQYEDTVKVMEKKEFDKERKKRHSQDKYLDNRELQLQHRKVKKEQEEMERARARERQEDTKKNLAKKSADRRKAKRLAADKRLDTAEMYRVMREQKKEQEWIQRDLAAERQEDTIKNLAKKEKDRKKAKRMKEDESLDQQEMFRVMRAQRASEEEVQRGLARASQEDTIKNLAKKEAEKEKAKRLAADKRLDTEEMYRTETKARSVYFFRIEALVPGNAQSFQ